MGFSLHCPCGSCCELPWLTLDTLGTEHMPVVLASPGRVHATFNSRSGKLASLTGENDLTKTDNQAGSWVFSLLSLSHFLQFRGNQELVPSIQALEPKLTQLLRVFCPVWWATLTGCSSLTLPSPHLPK